jgi:hypothetical protein
MAGRSVSDALTNVYTAFAGVPKPAQIPACPCCLNAAQVCALLDTPLRHLTPEQLTPYGSAVLLTSGSVADFKYFLPRILDISLHERFWCPDREVILGKLTLADWKSWPRTEIQPLLTLFEAAFDEAVVADDGWDVDSWLCALALARIDVTPYLRKLMEATALAALIGFIERNWSHLAKGKLSNAFWKDHKAEAAPIVRWAKSPEVEAVVQAYYVRQSQGDV